MDQQAGTGDPMKTVLLVEDEVLIADMIVRMLERGPGIRAVLHAIDAATAREMLATHAVDLALLDINLSGPMDGVELAAYIKAAHPMPFIFLTSQADHATLERVKASGANGYLNKPVNETTLHTNVALALQHARAQEEPLALHIGTQQLLFRRSDLLMARADHVYTTLYFKERREIVRMPLGKLLECLPEGALVRINRSEAVNPAHVRKTSRTTVWLGDGTELRLSPVFKGGLP